MKKAAKANQNVGTLSISIPGEVQAVAGTIVEVTDSYVVLNVKRPRSSKSDRKVYSLNNVLQFFSNGEEGTVLLRGTYEEAYADITLKTTENGFFVGTNEETGEQIIAAPDTWEFILDESEEEAPKKKTPAKKAPAKKVVEEEEEEEEEDDDEVEDEEEEEEEEEEAPKKKTPAKKAPTAKKAPAKKAPAKKAEEEDDEDDEDDDDWDD